MKNLTIGVITATAIFLLSAMSALAADQAFPISVSITPLNTQPEVFLAWRAFDLGIDVDGSGKTINPTDIRQNNYAFTGEKLYYFVLVRDVNGREDIDLVNWVAKNVDGSNDQEGPCDVIFPGLNLADVYTWCALPENDHTSFCMQFTSFVDQIVSELTNLDYDYQTDEAYMCPLTVESSWNYNNSEIYIKATDYSADNGGPSYGQMLSEYWDFNPPINVDVSLSSDLTLDLSNFKQDQAPTCVKAPDCTRTISESQTTRSCAQYNCITPGEKLCDISLSKNKLVITNNGIVDLWPFIAATNFYASNGMAKCPVSNELKANQFEYRATQGTWDSGWRIMPQYSENLGCTLMGQCRGGCRITTGNPLNVLSPTQSIDVAFKIVWPTPCIGDFDTGKIYAIVRAV